MAASAVHTLFQNILQAQLGATPRLIIAGSRKSESWWGNPRADRYRQPHRTVGNPPVHVQPLTGPGAKQEAPPSDVILPLGI